jgi:hypothetical protein
MLEPKYNLSECISVLNFIATIPENHKPCYGSKTTISKSGWFVKIRRRMNYEKGEDGVKYINDVLDSCDQHYRMCHDNMSIPDKDMDMDIDTCNIYDLSDALTISISGFNNLIITYNDQKRVSRGYEKCKSRVEGLIADMDNDKENDDCSTESKLMTLSPNQNKFFNSNQVRYIILPDK